MNLSESPTENVRRTRGMNIRDYWEKNNTNKLNTSRIQVRILRIDFLRRSDFRRIKNTTRKRGDEKVCTMYGSKYEPSTKGI